MPAATSISINDATPTAHVFVPVSVTPQLFVLRNTAGAANSATEEQAGLSLSRANSSRATNKVKVTLSKPHEQTIDGLVVVRDIARFTGEYTLPETMSATERNHFATLVKNLVSNADVEDYVADLEAFW